MGCIGAINGHTGQEASQALKAGETSMETLRHDKAAVPSRHSGLED
jgi:hypothetical protein